MNTQGLKAAFHRKVAISEKLSTPKGAFLHKQCAKARQGLLQKFISVHSRLYLNSNAQNKQKQKLAKNEVQGDFRNKSTSDCTAAKHFVRIFFISKKNNTANNNISGTAGQPTQQDKHWGKSNITHQMLTNAIWPLDTFSLV